jgi:hypothetical protein
MEISLLEIRVLFDKLIAQQLTREEIANSARKLREAEDEQALVYVPKSDENAIWEAILFLEGVDLKDSPETYLHNVEDFKHYRDKLFNDG